MTKVLIFLFTITASLSAIGIPQYFPESRDYVSKVDIGFAQYNTPSLHKTNKYVLTFDDGPHPTRTEQILDILKINGDKATFFICTRRVNKSTMPIIMRILKEGHILASHHRDHDNNNNVSKKNFRENLRVSLLTIKNLYKKAGIKMKHLYYRFPFAAYGLAKGYHHMNVIRDLSKSLFGGNCVRFVFWDNDSSDWVRGYTPSDIFENLKSFQEGGVYKSFEVIDGKVVHKSIENSLALEGGVILQHDIQQKTINATKMFLEYAKENYIKFIPLSSTKEYGYFPKECVQAFN